MKTLLCCAFLWVLPYGQLCEPVWAAEDEPVALASPVDFMCGVNRSSSFAPLCELPFAYTYDEKTDLWDRARDPVCLAQMEAAMRAMEPFISRWHISEDGNMVWKGDEVLGNESMTPLYFSTIPGDPYMKKFHKERENAQVNAQKLWDAAKTACWKEPK